MRILDIADALDRDDMLAVDADEGREAGIDGSVVDGFGGWVVLRDDLGGASVPFLKFMQTCRGLLARMRRR